MNSLTTGLTGGLLALALAAVPLAAAAGEGVVIYQADAEFDDAAFGLESAITDRGLVIDYVSHVGEMLARTKDDVGGARALFTAADIYIFCSAVVSRKVMEADPDNIAHCPYGIFVRQMAEGGAVEIGYRALPEGPMQEVQTLLDGIAREAAGVD
ncbi:hypothetical protein LNKW23_12140 [Paralimibaculum aggregatum]|uniref:DUF302 domain-containing protein n=1 Tax=Paralimibaculum aggregatum TaxID=3036245 RepID=A0ABQ6LHU3_9RHOB|nr:DUF302 domain-containing protein [Limibaculum sp. NKW23]GMG82001.1 hypothetical protein LNKW23_12140 [Limibaculum sp. NKW23]